MPYAPPSVRLEALQPVRQRDRPPTPAATTTASVSSTTTTITRVSCAVRVTPK